VSAFAGADVACTDEATAYIYIQEQPEPSFDLTDQLCWDGVTATTLMPIVNSPTYTNSVARVWSSSNPAAATIDSMTGVVTVIGSGTTTICLEETIAHDACSLYAASDCVVEVCQTLIITETNESVDASWTTFGPLCTDDTVVDLDILITGEANGVFTGSGVSGTHPNYSFAPSTGAGLYTITYTVSNGSGCTAVESHTVEVFGPVSAALNDVHLACLVQPGGSISLSSLFTTGTTPGGTFTLGTATGNAVISGQALVYQEPGCYEITYTVSAFSGADATCTDEATAYILISEQPQPSFDIQDQVCWSDGDDPMTHIYNPVVNSPVYTDAVTRVFSVQSGPASLLNATTGQIQVTGIGTVILRLTETITYEVCGTTPTGTCEEIYEVQITVSDGTAQDASFTVSDLFPCLDEVVMLTPAETGGQFTGTGVTDNGNGTGATFSFNTLGIYSVTYTLNNPNGCSNVYTVNITVQDLPAVISCPADVDLSCDDPLPLAATNITEFMALGGTVTDDCADAAMIANFAISAVDQGNGNSVCPDDGMKIVTRTYTITDLAGNETVCQQFFNYAEDASPPLITTMAMDETVECDGSGNAMELANWLATVGGAIATDNGSCSTDLELIWTNELLQTVEMCGETVTYTYRFTVSDLCGNTASTDADFIIEDTTDPVITMEAENLTITCMDGDILTPELLEWLDANGNATATDDCGNLTWTNDLDLSAAAALCATGGTIPVTFTVTDECGNDITTEADLIITQVSSLGVAKRVVSLVNNPDGSATITYEINVENFGTVDLDSLQVTDDLFETFPAPCAITNVIITSDDYLVNVNFNGLTDVNLLLGSDVLQAEDKGSILLTITVGACGLNNGPFFNYAEADAVQGDGTHITDTSNWGVDPDPNGDGIPDEESGTPVTFEEMVNLGVAKDLIFAQINPDGSYDITYEFNIQNFGTVNFTGLRLQDNLRATFPETCEIEVTLLTSGEFDTNNDFFDGINDIELLTGTDVLEPGEDGSVNLSLHVTNCGGDLGPFFNNATLSGIAPDGMTYFDASVDGTQPDPNGDNNPSEFSPTVVDFEENPFLGVAKRVSEGPTLRADGYFEITYEVRVQNFGDVNLEVLGVYDNLAQTFAGATDWMLIGIESEEFAVNINYNGIDELNLIEPGDILIPNEEGAIYITVKVAPGGFPGPYLNTVFANSISPFGTIANDDSQDGSDPDFDGDGDPTNDEEETPVTLDCFVGIICPAVTDTIIVDNDLGWCQAAVNFPPAEIVTCAGVPDSLIEFKLLGDGAMDTALDTWIAGQPSGLMYNVGLTEVLIRTSVPSLPMLGYSDTCSFFIRVNDKEVPAILCQDITVPVGSNCEYVLTPDRLDAGSTDNCTDPAGLVYEISLDNVTYTDELIFGVDDLLMSPITVYLRITDEYGNFSLCTNEVNLVDDTAPQIICPEDRDIPADENLCVGIIPDLMAEMTIDNCAPIDTVFQVPAAGLLFGTADGDMITVVLTVVDINGNTDTCGVVLTLIDETPPTFLNCPAPNVVLTSLPGLCSNFANFSLPEAIDNCGIGVVVTQTDDTGLTSGDMFPVGTTILEFTATDPAGNTTVCTRKVIINDNDDPTAIIGDGCPADLNVNVSPGECGAFVGNISPRFQDNCEDNLTTVYRLVDGLGNTITDGLADASGEFFMLGTTTVEYRAQDQPLLLITEMTHDLQATVGGTDPVPAFITSGPPDGDFLEITNFGPASMDVSCLGIERHHAGGSESIALPRFTILAPGEVLTIHFGDGTDDQADGYFNVAGAANLTPGEGAAYVISHSGTVLDVAVLGNFNPVGLGTLATVNSVDWSGQVNGALSGAIRTFVWDTNTAGDFVAAAVCGNTTIGSLNPQLPQPADNGGLTSLQSQLPNTITCTFTVTVGDNEFPRCGTEGEALVYNNFNGGQFFAGDCIESTLLVTDFGLLADVNLHFTGTTNAFGNLDVSLISPNGTEIDLASAICGTAPGWDLTFDSDSIPSILSACNLLDVGEELSPVNSLEQFVGQAANGSWTLRLGHNGSLNQDPITFEGWSLELRLQTSYDQPDIIVANDLGECSALLEWRHPIFFDNCPDGTIQLMIVTEDGQQLSNGQLAESNWGALTTFNFPVGTTNVNYTLTDAAGNVTECGFSVTVNDEELPVVNCPDDVVIQLGPGECEVAYTPLDLDITDNCGDYTVVATPSFNTLLPIGETVVTVVITDAAGNPIVCTYTVTVLEFMPEDPAMACIEQINVSLGPDCTREITAEMILTGNNYYCYDNYEVTLLDAPEGDALPSSPFVTEEHIGQTVVVMICDLINDVCCWGYVNVGFYEAPTFECPADTTLSCIELTTPAFTGQPVLLSCALGGADISYQDLVQENGTCADTILIIDRTWTVADAAGNSNSCVQQIVVETFHLEDIVFPTDRDGVSLPALSCSAVAANPLLTHPDSTGYPTLDGSTEVFGVNNCSASYLYTDEIYNICAGSYEILRTWKVRNTCLPVVVGQNPREHIQLIRVLDQEDPQVVCPDDLIISTSPLTCTAYYPIPAPLMMNDGCSNTSYTVSVSGGALTFVNGNYTLSNLAPGTYTITYRVRDECNRRTTCSYNVTVEDLIEPTAACDDLLQISLGGQGIARITAADLDEGSYDACGPVSLAIRRAYTRDPEDCSEVTDYFSPWDDEQYFSCCDLNETVRLELLVTDLQGNTNTCWLEVVIEDKLAPFCTAPANQTVTCAEWPLLFSGGLEDAYANDFAATSLTMNELFGGPTGTDNCTVDTLVERAPNIQINDCGWGTITRRFAAWQWNGDTNGNGAIDINEVLSSVNNCTQVITITEVHDYAISFPADGDAACTDGEVNWDEIATFADGCDVLVVNIGEPDIFPATADECYKLRIPYTIINWCVWDGEVEPINLSRDEDNDDQPGEAFWVYRRADNNLAVIDTDNDRTNGFIREVVDRGHWKYYQFVKVYDNTAPVIEDSGALEFCATPACDTLVTLNLSITDDCGLNGLQIISVAADNNAVDVNGNGTIESNEFFTDITVTEQATYDGAGGLTYSGVHPIGVHALRVVLTDGCGNTVSHYTTFRVNDCVATAPICINGLTVTLMPTPEGDCAAAIWVTDYLASPVVDCSGPLQYAIYRATEVAAAGEDFAPDPVRNGLVLTTADEATTVLYIYAIDTAGNFEYCETYVLVQPGDPSCSVGESATISGVIMTEDAEAVAAVEVSLSGGNSATMTTGNDGAYTFGNLEAGQDYSVTPYSNANPLNGVSTFDIILISKHILAVQPLNSPYKRIAADVNRSGTITTLDLIQLRKLILNITTEFANNTSWRFVDQNYVFPEPTNPWMEAFPELINANNVITTIDDADFVAVKIGDVNGSAQANALSSDDRTLEERLQLEIENADLRQGNVYTIAVTAGTASGMNGFQGTLELQGLELMAIEHTRTTAANFGVQAAESGFVTMSWNQAAGDPSLSATDVLFSLVVRAVADQRLSDGLQISSRYTEAEAYRANALHDLGLQFVESTWPGAEFALYQNTPNPFKAESVIGFYLPEALPATLTVQDVSGRVVLLLKKDCTAGYHDFTLTEQQLKGYAGVLTYTLRAGDYQASKSMIVVK
jgi:subtilisin-like proprotein convertase family protein